MSENKPKKKKNLFERESTILKESQNALKEEESGDFFKDKLKVIVDHYEELLDQSKLITKVSDRLQKKITKANTELGQKNDELQQTLDALTKAKVGRRAATITLLIFLVLVLISEGFLEPGIEDYLETSDGILKQYQGEIGIALKAGLALLLRPIEKVVEQILLKSAEKRQLAGIRKQPK